MKKILPPLLVSAALACAVLLSRSAGPSRESLMPMSRAVADHEKAVDRAAAVAFPVSADEERRVGAAMDAQARALYPAPTGADALARASRWRALGEQAQASPLVTRFRGRYEFRSARSSQINAFALPGGYVYAFDPLIKRLDGDDDALFFVVAHEIGHVELGHCADAFRLRPDGKNPLRDLAGGVLSIARVLPAMQFSSNQELEADAYAVRLMRSLGRDPKAALRAYDKLAMGAGEDKSTKRDPGRLLGEAVGGFFRTHPGGWERRAALERDAAAASGR